MSLNLPKFELYETGSQIRRSSKSTKATIVEGYGRPIYKSEFSKFLVYASSSNDETRDHLETLFDTKSLTDLNAYNSILSKVNLLGKKIYNFQKGVDREHESRR